MKKIFLVLCASCLWLVLSSAQAATYSFRNDPYTYDTPSGAASTVAWHAGRDGTWLNSPACTQYPNGDDDWADVTFPGGFSFVFGGVTYTQVRIYSNGMLVFGNDDSGFHRDYTPQTLPITTAGTPGPQGDCTLSAVPANLMIAYWIDIVAGSARGVTLDSVKYELLGTAPNRRFVISWNNVALYSTTTTRYTFQIALFQSASGVNGDFEYRYTSGSSTGANATVGVQLSTTDYTLYAYNNTFIDTTNGTNIHWFPQTTFASTGGVYHFDEASWNHTPGEVIDSSGIVPAQNATAAGAANTVATSKCGTGLTGNFPANTLNTTINAVATPLVPGRTGSIDFWYYSNASSSWNTSAAAMLFDASTVANRPFYLMKTATGALQFTVSDSAGTIRTTTSAVQTFAQNTWQHIGVSWDFLPGTNQTYIQIFLNGVLLTSARYTTNGTIATLGTLYIGDNRTSGVTPSGGSPNSANGYIDEVKVYTSQISVYQVITDMSCTGLIDHMLIQSASTGLACVYNPLTIVACQNAACTVNYAAGVTGTLSAIGASMTVNWDGASGGATGSGFALGSTGTATKNVLVTTQGAATSGSVVIGLSSPNPVPTNATVCNFGNNAASNNCVFTVTTTGLIFTGSATSNSSYFFPAQVSGTPTGTLYLRAVKSAAGNPAVCTPAIASQTSSVTMGYTCNNPATCQSGNLATINATPIAPAGTSVNLTFDANGYAPFTARYDDVGLITLNANSAVAPLTGINAMTNAFVVAPHHFGFSSITAAPIKAGSNFSATVSAYNNLATPTVTANFGKETTPESVTISRTKCQPTGTGSVNGSFTSDSTITFSSGAANLTSLNWSEVGNIDLDATLSSANYLGSGITATGNSGTNGVDCSTGGAGKAGNVGPFVAHHFDTAVTQGCAAGGYTYSGQPFTVTVTARNGLATPTTTVNYDGSANTSPNFSKDVTLSDGSASASGSLSNTAVAASAFTAGVATTNTPVYTFNNQATTRQTAPTTITLRATDANASSSGFTEGAAQVRAGRVRVANAHGSVRLDLPVPMLAQYWSGTGWVKNTSDVCTGDTTLGAANAVAVTLTAVTLPAGSTCVWDTGILSGLSGVGCSTAGLSARRYKEGATPGIGFSGDFNLWLKAPGSAGAVTVGGSVPAWLQYDWSGAGVANPTGRATFGVYKGTNEFIYQREAY